MASTICPFCREQIKSNAIVCKHCHQDLSGYRREEADKVQAQKDQQAAQGQKSLKFIAWILLVGIGIWLWYIVIPAVAIWYTWKKTRWSKKQKFIGTGVFCVLAIVFISIHVYTSQPPTLNILEPGNNHTIQAKTVSVKGTVKPSGSKVFVNNQPANIEADGNFNHEAALSGESNHVLIKATHNDKSVERTLTVNRTLTEAEKVELARQKVETEKAKQAAAEKTEADRITKNKEQLQRELDSFDKSFDSTSYRGSVDALTLEVALFGAWAQMVSEYQQDADPEVKTMADQLEQKASQLQVKEFPLMRKHYAEVLAKKLWEENIDIVSLGNTNKTIEFTGAVFANNKYIGQTQTGLKETLQLFRFTRANYKWYKYDSDYTYYEIESQADGEVVAIGS